MTPDNAGVSQGNAERDAEIYSLKVVQCWSDLKIAGRFGISQQRVSAIVAAQRAKLPPVDLEAIRAKALALHEDVILRAFALAELPGTPVFVGKDGDMAQDEDGSVVRDYAGRMSALALALKADEARRKLMGVDAASKTELSGAVRYEVVGVDLEALK